MLAYTGELSIRLMGGWSNESRVMTSESSRYNGRVSAMKGHQNRSQRLYHRSCDWHQIHFVADDCHCRSGAAPSEAE